MDLKVCTSHLIWFIGVFSPCSYIPLSHTHTASLSYIHTYTQKHIDESWPSSDCYGHGLNDTVVGIYADTDTGKYVSTQALYTATDPTNAESELLFLYDDFSWTHCAEAGIPTDLSSSSTSSAAAATEEAMMMMMAKEEKKEGTVSREALERSAKRKARTKARAQFKPKGSRARVAGAWLYK